MPARTAGQIAVAWCETHQKLLYATRKAARRGARKHPDKHKTAYPCDALRGWHNGSLHQLVMQGHRFRDDLGKRNVA